MATYTPKRYGRGDWILGAARMCNIAIACGVCGYIAWNVAVWIAAVVIRAVFG